MKMLRPNISSALMRRSGIVLLAAAAAFAPLRADESDGPLPKSRGGYSRNMVRNANDNDVRSALRAYAAVISNANQISAEPDQILYTSLGEMEQSLRESRVDVIVAPADEILRLPAELLEPPFGTSFTAGAAGVEYVLLSRRDGPVATPADLRARSLGVLDSSQGCLATRWLDSLLVEHRLGSASTVLRQLKPCSKPALATLPVFFKQLDACIITRTSFDTLCELNPRLKSDLRIVATSPRLLPVLSGFRRGIDARLKTSITQAMTTIGSTTAGRQLLTLFQTDNLAFCEDDTLAATRRLFAPSPAHSAPLLPRAP